MSNKQTTDEKDFARAMCTTCLLEWPMAQCLSCKFYAVEREVEFDEKTMTRSNSMDILGYRMVYDVDPAKAYQVADVLLDGAILPVSIPTSEINPVDAAQSIEQAIDATLNDLDPRTPAQIEMDEIAADWKNQVNEYRG